MRAMRVLHTWYAILAAVPRVLMCMMFLAMCFYIAFMEVTMAVLKDFSDDERDLMLGSLDLAIASCERRSNRAGETAAIKTELAKLAERYRAIKSKLVLTK